MATSITLRSTKGSALTHSEMDANLTNLQTTADAAKAATDTLTSNKAEATALGVANTDQNMGSFTGTTIADNVSAKVGMQSLETAVETKAASAALGVTATAANMGTYTGTTIPDNETAKQNLQSLETAVEARPTSATLAATTGAALIGANDASSGAKYTTVQGFITYLLSSVGSAIVGFIQSGTGAVAETAQTTLRRVKYAAQYGVTADGATDDTTALANAITAASGGTLILPAGTMIATRLTVPSNTIIRGAGRGVSILKIKDASNQTLIVNSDGTNGNSNIGFYDFTIDGNYLNQTASANGILWDKVTLSEMDNVEIKNCRGMGMTISAGGQNRFGSGMYVHGNGKTEAGYGIYCFCSSDNQFVGGIYDDNCIGIAIEASGGALNGRRNVVNGVLARLNRADFSQSGAGVHFEASAGSDCNDCSVTGSIITGGTGVGINNTAVHGLNLTGNTIADNGFPGISTTGANDILYVGNTVTDNGGSGTAGAANRGNIHFGDASSGIVAANRVEGNSPDGSIRTTAAGNAVRFIYNEVEDATSEYVLSGSGDLKLLSKKSTFTINLSGCTAAVSGSVTAFVEGGEVVIQVASAISGTSGSAVMQLTGIPNAFYPSYAQVVDVFVTDNGVTKYGSARVATNAVIDLGVGATVDGFTGSGTKGLPAGIEIRYRL